MLGPDLLQGHLTAQFLIEGHEHLAQPAADMPPEDAEPTAGTHRIARGGSGARGAGRTAVWPGRVIVSRHADGLARLNSTIGSRKFRSRSISAGVAPGSLRGTGLGGDRLLQTGSRRSIADGVRLREDGLDKHGVTGEAVAILLAVRRLAPGYSGRELGGQQLPQQDRPSRLGLQRQGVFDPRPAACARRPRGDRSAG